ncbi:class I SAM-dependent methyltransferase [Pseudolysinimonas sp.]|jgi:SAM-dependent methyltransferase|uniref:class I SAM-dependent methyltransferase n=1 Tax=Pseudolysinimonas sp. TaxID=2680009 RepID=UPI003784CCAF
MTASDNHHPSHSHYENWEEQLVALDVEGSLARPWLASAAHWVVEGLDVQRVIDAGSGPAYASVEFALRQPNAIVIAVDPTQPFLDRGSVVAAEAGVADRVELVRGRIDDLGTLPAADIVWASHVVHHTPDPGAAIAALAASTTPGGRVAIAEGGLPMRNLPGGYGVSDPGLMARLEAELSRYYRERWNMTDAALSGERDWPDRMRDAGLIDVESRTFVLDLTAPVSRVARQHIVRHFEHVRDAVGTRLPEADRVALDVLLDREDPRSLIRRADLFLLSANTVHRGTRV